MTRDDTTRAGAPSPGSDRAAPPRHALLLIGSAKPAGGSASEALGCALLERLAARGVGGETLYANRVAHEGRGRAALLAAVDRADLLVIASPLYADTFPYLVTLALERIAAHRAAQDAPRPGRVLVVMNNGFPEAEHNLPALAVGRCFAHQAGFAWAGGLALGGGEMLSRQGFERIGSMARDVLQALDLTADALARGDAVPAEAARRMAGPLIPVRLYTLMGDVGWVLQARESGALRALLRRPANDPEAR